MTEAFRPVQHLPLNTAGVDFVVGDIHGRFDLVYALMKKVQFDPACDRFIATGDLVDRGPLSHLAIDFLKDSSCYSVRGNHEQMIIDYCYDLFKTNSDLDTLPNLIQNDLLIQNGGQWFLDLPREAKLAYAHTFKRLPYAIDIQTPYGLVGVVHAECPVNHWEDLSVALSGEMMDGFINRTLWDGGQYNSCLQKHISGIHCIFVGHTIVEQTITLGNTTYIDTGAAQFNHLTAIRLDTMTVIS